MPAASEASTRAVPRALWGLALSLLALRLGFGFWEDRHPPAFPSLIQWVPAGQAAQVAAEREAPLLFVFSASWCQPCKVMDREVFADAEVAKKVNETFVPVHVVEGGSPGQATAEEASALVDHYGVGGYPTLVVEEPGRPPTVKTGYEGEEPTRRFLTGGWRKKQLPTSFKDFMAQVKQALDGGVRDGGRFLNSEDYDLPPGAGARLGGDGGWPP